MSIPTKEQASRFLAPLRGSLSILLLHETQAKVSVSRFMLRCASLQAIDTTILDADAFYCTNMERFAEDAQSIAKGEVLLLLPEQEFEVSSLVPLLLRPPAPRSSREFRIGGLGEARGVRT
ncbi:MAG: hypothetical protein OK454_00995 [Thaumarchaeota archaeon]|nr:hypothetical protein [Nitrososphaerota archaeon]